MRPDQPVVPVVTAWGADERARLVFQIKLFMPSLCASTDPPIVQLLYIQSVYNIITGLYPTSMDDAVSLASLQAQAKYGNSDPAKHKPGFLLRVLRGMVPSPLYARKAASQWEAEILARHAQLNSEAQEAPTALYSRILMTREYFGCAFFDVKQTCLLDMNENITLGIKANGVFLLDRATKATFRRHALPDIYRWGFKPGKSFYFEMKSSATEFSDRLFEFPTIECGLINDLLSDYATQVLLEMELNKAEAAAPLAAAAPSASAAASSGRPRAGSSRPPRTEAEYATRLQSAWRGYAVRNGLHRDFAAMRIQALVRGFIARCRFDRMLEELEAEYA